MMEFKLFNIVDIYIFIALFIIVTIYLIWLFWDYKDKILWPTKQIIVNYFEVKLLILWIAFILIIIGVCITPDFTRTCIKKMLDFWFHYGYL